MVRKSKIITHAGVTLDLAQVKCFKLLWFTTNNGVNHLVIELVERVEYVFHPGTQQWEKIHFNESIACNFPNYDSAQAHLLEWEEIWQNYSR